MNVLKLGLISAVVFSVILFLMSLLIPSTVRISRAIDIYGKDVDRQIADLGSWPGWNELYNDSARISILRTDTNFIETIWEYKGNKVSGNFKLEHSAGITVVQWYFDFKLKWYPWEKFGSIIFDKQFGPPMERSLNKLKKLVEHELP